MAVGGLDERWDKRTGGIGVRQGDGIDIRGRDAADK